MYFIGKKSEKMRKIIFSGKTLKMATFSVNTDLKGGGFENGKS